MEVAKPLDDNSGSTNKRRKVGNGELRFPSSKSVRITGCDGDDVINSDEMSSISGELPTSCCSIDVSVKEKLKFSDLEETAETETTVRCNLSRRESFPLKELKTHSLSSNLMAGKFSKPTCEFKEKSSEMQTNSRRTILPEKTPPADEIEEFFAAAEKEIQNRFKDKYNYDIVNDVPLKGRFEWIELKP